MENNGMTAKSRRYIATIRFYKASDPAGKYTRYHPARDSRETKERQENTMKCKNMMYEQQLAHLPKTKEQIFDTANKKLNAKRCALIVHDKDIRSDGTPVADHIHLMMAFDNARSLNNVAKILGDNPQQFEKWNDKADNGFSYLVHATSGSQDKYQYDPADVIANFDYPAFLKKTSISVATSGGHHKTSDLLDCFYAGAMSRKEVEQSLSGSQYGKFSRQLDAIEHKRMVEEAEKWRKQKIKENAVIKTLWLYGAEGTGKTTLAREIAEKKKDPYFITGSSRDIFQAYRGEHSIIIDEFRPNSISYDDLLKITDPHGIANQIMLPSRYKDKPFASDLIIITSPYSPWNWYDELFHITQNGSIQNYKKDLTDSFGQLNRRIELVIFVDSDFMYAMEYDPALHEYEAIDGSKKPNPYSSKQRQSSAVDPLEIYNTLTG